MARLTLDNVRVEFPVLDGTHRSLRRAVVQLRIGGVIARGRRNYVTVRAIDGLSLDLHDGDRVGLIGHNGAGKSTLLRLMAGICEPTSGRARIEGRTAALLNLHSILDPEMTGHENIERACVLLEIPVRRRAAVAVDVVAFTELGDFLALPVKTYSAGMQLRLSLGLMTAQEPDILLLDEVMGAGDARFRDKARQRIRDLGEKTKIVVFASHGDDDLRQMCNKLVWLEHGRIRAMGGVEDILAAYAAARAQE